MKMERTRQSTTRQPARWPTGRLSGQRIGRRTERPSGQPADAGRRALWIGAVLLVWMFLIIGRLAWLQVARHDHYSERAALNQRKEVKTVAARGPIVDRDGRELAVSAIADSVYVDLKQLKGEADREKAARALSPLLGFDQSE